MAKKKHAQVPDGVLVTAAKTIGAAAGKIAAAVGVTVTSKPKVTKPKAKKLVKMSKVRLAPLKKKAVRKAVKKSA